MPITNPAIGSTDWGGPVNDTIDRVNELEGIETTIAAKQPLDSDLTAVAALTPSNDDVLQRKSGAWTNRTIAQLKTDLSLQPLDQDLTDIAALSPTNNDFMQRKSGAWTNRTPAQALTDLAAAPLASPTFTGTVTTPRLINPPVTLTDAATIAVDASLGNFYRVTLGGNRTLGAPTNPTDGQKILIEVLQDGTGSRTLAYNAIYGFGTDVTSPTLSTGIGKRDYLGFIYNSTATKWFCLAVAKGY